jgi:hypothetical protein
MHRCYPGWGMDGQVLHNSEARVPPERWCVTREDFRFLREEIQAAVRNEEIIPIPVDPLTGRGDLFDREDNVGGPSMYNVVDSYVKPLTDTAGKMSWALLRHPMGLSCDLFITHCWAEGAYELIDKVLASWPRGKHHAWCCILANPQNLDIGHLIGQPSLSPFALALKSATHMMVVPNTKCSNYSRIWCVYEAYLAYSQDKIIFTGRAPMTIRSWRKHRGLALEGSVLGMLTGALVPVWSMACPVHASSTCISEMVVRSLFLCGLFAGGSLCLSFTALITIQCVVNSAGFFLTMFSFASMWRYFNDNLCYVLSNCGEDEAVLSSIALYLFSLLYYIFLLAIFSASEVQRMRGNLLRLEHQALCSHYTSVREADASCEEDKRSILAEIGDRWPEVDNCIRILSIVGMSTRGLRYAIERGANITSVADSRFPWIGLAAWMLGVVEIIVSYLNGPIADVGGVSAVSAVFAASLCCPIVFVIVWFHAEMDKRAFIKASMTKLMMISPVVFFLVIFPFLPESRLFFFVHAVFGLMAIVCAALGIQGVASIPYVGPCLASALGPGWWCPLAEQFKSRGVTDVP